MKGQTLSLKTKVDVSGRLREIERTRTVVIDQNTHVNRCYILIGLPCSGKTHLVNSFLRHWRGVYPVLLSEDMMIEEESKRSGEHWDEVIARTDPKVLSERLMEGFYQALGVHRDIIVDRCNLSCDDRADIIDKLPSHYQKIAILFTIPKAVVLTRLQTRSKETGRVYSPSLIETMSRRLEMPDHDEFHRVTTIDQHCVF